MMSNSIFCEMDLRDFLNNKISEIIISIQNENDNYLLNVNEDEYIQYKVKEAYVEPLIIDFDNISVSQTKKMIPAEYFPTVFNVSLGREYERTVIVYHLPYYGTRELLHCVPTSLSTSLSLWTYPVEITNNEIRFEIINFSDNSEKIKNEQIQITNSIKNRYISVVTQVNSHNSNIEPYIRKSFHERKNKILSENKLLASLGVPLAKVENVSPTFSIPSPQLRKKIKVSRPIAKTTSFVPEPSLDEQMYSEILKIIHDTGKSFERAPSIYAHKEEEDLRDHIIMMLTPHFDGSVTGETFNKTGKTDILLRYENNNVFIAECKFWHGEKGFLDTISQLLGYLTWRDSKAAVIMFVKNKDFSSVLLKAAETIKEHRNFVKNKEAIEDTWNNYLFHLNGDKDRMVHLATMFYHIP